MHRLDAVSGIAGADDMVCFESDHGRLVDSKRARRPVAKFKKEAFKFKKEAYKKGVRLLIQK